MAKDAAGICKSLGADIFTVSWQRAGDAQPATAGTAAHVPASPAARIVPACSRRGAQAMRRLNACVLACASRRQEPA